MSGIVGILNLDGRAVDRALLCRLTESLRFRGPDAQGIFTFGNAGFGFTYLKLTDETDANEGQPFTLDGHRWVVADARIDGVADLIAELRVSGQDDVQSTATDAELILRAYVVWDERCVEHLLGDFTFAVWDAPRQRLFGARDQLGVKPLFYANIDGVLIVSNTLDCIRVHPAVSHDLNESAVADFLLFGANQDPATTSFRDIHRLPAAHCLTSSLDGTQCRRYWTLPVDEPIYFRRTDDYSDRFRELLRTALRDRLRTGRAGVLMSGGVDSTALAAVALSILRERPTGFALQAITSVYDRLIPDSERYYATLTADYLKIPIHFDVRDDEISIVDWDRVSIRTPEPVDNPAACAASVAFLRRVACDQRVFLYGEGPDNALQYEWRRYLADLVSSRHWKRLFSALAHDLVLHRRVPFRSSIRDMIAARRDQHLWTEPFPVWLNEDFAARCRCHERFSGRQSSSPSAHSVRPRAYNGLSDVRWQSLFEDCDINGAIAHAEIRHPFLDLRVLRYMLSLPAMPWCRNKLIIRRSMRSMLPREVLTRRKTSVAESPDLARVRAFGLPGLRPCNALLDYVNPDRVLSVPESAAELRTVLRPLGLNYWLGNLNTN